MLEYGNVAVNLCSVPLGHTLSNPQDVAIFLLFQANVSIEHTKLELLHESFLHQLNLQKKIQKTMYATKHTPTLIQ